MFAGHTEILSEQLHFRCLMAACRRQSFQKLFVNVTLEDQLATLTRAEVDLAGGRVEAHGRIATSSRQFWIGPRAASTCRR